MASHPPFEVDFVYTDPDKDVPVYLDLYLMYETPDEAWNEVHTIVFWYFNNLLEKYRSKQITADQLLDALYFPEVKELGFGHCIAGTEGAGTARKRAKLLKDSIFDNKSVREIGLPALAKVAIQIEGFGPDLLSDMVGGFAIDYLLSYTNEQVLTYDLKTMSVNIQRGYDFRTKTWKPRMKVNLPYFKNGEPRLLAPRHVSRKMPILSTDEFYKGFLKYVLEHEELARLKAISSIGSDPKIKIQDLEAKLEEEYEKLSAATRKIATERPELVDQYIDNPHKFDKRRRPRKPKIDWDGYITNLKNVPAGIEASKEYSEMLLSIFQAMYGDSLLRGKVEVRSYENTYRYDVNFLNASSTSFFKVLEKAGIQAASIILEAKNYDKAKVENKEFNQGLAYTLKDRREFVFLVQREEITKKHLERAQQHYLRHGVIVFPISDKDILEMLELRKTFEKDFDSVLEDRLQTILSA